MAGGEVGNMENGDQIPIILRVCVQYIITSPENLETEGLFRFFYFFIYLFFIFYLSFLFLKFICLTNSIRVSPNYREIEDLKTLFLTPNTVVDLSHEEVLNLLTFLSCHLF